MSESARSLLERLDIPIERLYEDELGKWADAIRAESDRERSGLFAQIEEAHTIRRETNEALAAAQAEIAALQELLAEMVQDIPSESHQERVIDRIHNLEDEIAARDARIAELERITTAVEAAGRSFAKERDDSIAVYREGFKRLEAQRDTLTARVRELEATLELLAEPKNWDNGGYPVRASLIAQKALAASATTDPAPDPREALPRYDYVNADRE